MTIKPINPGWIKQAETRLACTAPGPDRDALAEEIAEAKKGLTAWTAFVAKAKAAGYSRNEYEVRCADGTTLAPFKGFSRKVGKKNVGYTIEQVVAAIGE